MTQLEHGVMANPDNFSRILHCPNAPCPRRFDFAVPCSLLREVVHGIRREVEACQEKAPLFGHMFLTFGTSLQSLPRHEARALEKHGSSTSFESLPACLDESGNGDGDDADSHIDNYLTDV